VAFKKNHLKMGYFEKSDQNLLTISASIIQSKFFKVFEQKAFKINQFQ
jgi:hypothetical protein